jgi:hypothetical protein
MTIAAHTNEVGDWTKHEGRYDINEGIARGKPDYAIEGHNVAVARSVKPAPVKGDRKNPTPYSRHICAVTKETPYIWSDPGYTAFGYEAPETDMTYTRWLSAGIPTMEFLPPPSLNVKLQNAKARSETIARNRLRQMKVQLGASLAEAVSTVDTVAQTAATLWEFLIRAKRASLNNAVTYLSGRSPASTYLGVTYGWVPMIKSVFETAELLKYIDKEKPLTLRASCKSHVKFNQTDEDGDHENQWAMSGGVRCSLEASVTSYALLNADTAGLINPAEIAWEVVPYSFVVDWGIPVGTFLQSLSATAGLNFSSGYTSVWYQADVTRRVVSHPWWRKVMSNGEVCIGRYTTARIPHNGFPPAQLFGKENPFSTPHVLNALALFGKLF